MVALTGETVTFLQPRPPLLRDSHLPGTRIYKQYESLIARKPYLPIKLFLALKIR
jgi:hypothetical protein